MSCQITHISSLFFSAGSCDPDTDDWKMYDDRCWFFSPLSPDVVQSPMDWTMAENFCNSLGANLASIHNSDQNNFVKGQVGYIVAGLWQNVYQSLVNVSEALYLTCTV